MPLVLEEWTDSPVVSNNNNNNNIFFVLSVWW